MNLTLTLLTVSALLICLDHGLNREIENRRRAQRSCRRELLLQGLAYLLSPVLLWVLAWLEVHGGKSFGLLAGLGCVIVMQMAAPSSRPLWIAANWTSGAVAAWLTPIVFAWSLLPSAVYVVPAEMLALVATLAAVPLAYLGARNFAAAVSLYRPPRWQVEPLRLGPVQSGRRTLVIGVTDEIGDLICRSMLEMGDEVWAAVANIEVATAQFGRSVRVVADLHELPQSVRFDSVTYVAPVADQRGDVTRKSLLQLHQTAALLRRLDRPPERVTVVLRVIRGQTTVSSGQPESSHSVQLLRSAVQKIERAAGTRGARVCALWLPATVVAGAGRRLHLAGPAALQKLHDLELPWIHADDVVGAIAHLTDNPSVARNTYIQAPERLPVDVFVRLLPLRLRLNAWFSRRDPSSRRLEPTVSYDNTQPGAPLLDYDYIHGSSKLSTASRFARKENDATSSLTLYINCGCPFYAAQARLYSRLARRSNVELRIVDINRRPAALAELGLDFSALERRAYTVSESAEVSSGLDALATVWARLPGLRALSRMLRVECVHWTSTLVHDLLVAPAVVMWARRRRGQLFRAAARRRT